MRDALSPSLKRTRWLDQNGGCQPGITCLNGQTRIGNVRLLTRLFDFSNPANPARQVLRYNGATFTGTVIVEVKGEQWTWDIDHRHDPAVLTAICAGQDDPIGMFMMDETVTQLSDLFGVLGVIASAAAGEPGFIDAATPGAQEVLAGLLYHGTPEQRCAAADVVWWSNSSPDELTPFVPHLLFAWAQPASEASDQCAAFRLALEEVTEQSLPTIEEYHDWWLSTQP